MLLRCLNALVLAAVLVGCSTHSMARREQAERILNRTITETQTVTVEVDKLVALPSNLTQPCAITRNKDRTVGEYVRVANENTASLVDCSRRMDEIRKLQPKN